MEFWREPVSCRRTGNRKYSRANSYSVRRWNEQISRCGRTEVWSARDRADRNTVFRQVWSLMKEPTRECTDARERIVWNKHASRCQASGAGDGWRQKRDFFEVAGGWVWQQHASHRTVEPEDSLVLWQGAHGNDPASKERGPWRESVACIICRRIVRSWRRWKYNVFVSLVKWRSWWSEMPDSKMDPGRILGCGLSWMEEWRIQLITIDTNVHLARRRAEPNQMNSVFDELSLSRLFVIQTQILPMQSTSLDVKVVHVVDDTVVVDLHVIGISMNGEAVLVSDTEDICCKKDEIQRSEHRALRYAAFNHGYFRRSTVVSYVLSLTCDVRDDPFECIFINAESYVQSPDEDDMINAVERGTHVEHPE